MEERKKINKLNAFFDFSLFQIIQQECDMNGVPSLTLPSISEDDENVPEDGETSPLSPPNKSPIHVATSPRHAKFRYIERNNSYQRIAIFL